MKLNTYLGKPIKGAYEDYLERNKSSEGRNHSKTISPPSEFLPELVRRNPKDFIKIPEKSQVIAKRPDYNNLNWQQALEKSQESNLILPRIDVFMQHYLNLKEAANGKRPIYDAAGKLIDKDEAKDHWNYLSSTNRKPFNNEVFWTWLDAYFKKNSNDELYLQTNHRIINGQVKSQNISLDQYVESDAYVNLDFNKQGLPKSISQSEGYVQGKNIYYWSPIENGVARFRAGSGMAVLGCDRSPGYSISSFWVLSCAEGAQI